MAEKAAKKKAAAAAAVVHAHWFVSFASKKLPDACTGSYSYQLT